jgi:hypothetical protein
LQEGLLAAEDEERSDSATEDKESPEKENES